MNKILVGYLISVFVIGTVLPAVHSDSTFFTLNSQEQTSLGDNQSPIFGTPTPVDGSANNPLSFTWNIPINDPEGNAFSWTIQCSNGQNNSGTNTSNGTKSLVLSGLEYLTNYKVWVNSTDSTGSGLYTINCYTFITKQGPTMKVIIAKPLENTLYIQDKEYLIHKLPTTTIVYGPINITADVISEVSIARVEFYVDGWLKHTVKTTPYTYLWNPVIQFNEHSLNHIIKIIVYDNIGNQASAEVNITKWRVHPLPFIMQGVGIATSFFEHTRVTGLFFDVQHTPFSTSFYAVRIHYQTIGPSKYVKGIINFKQCTGGMIIGPISLLQIGPLHKFKIGTFTFLGDIQYNLYGFEQRFNTTLPIT